MKDQTNTGTVTTFIRHIFRRFVSNNTDMPGFGPQEKSCSLKNRYQSTPTEKEPDTIIMNINDIPATNDYDSTY